MAKNKVNAEEGRKHWAGAQRPKQGPGEQPRRATFGADVYTRKPSVKLDFLLRQRAKNAGLLPGSPRWRAYVLGGLSTAARQRREKLEKRRTDETGLVTPGK